MKYLHWSLIFNKVAGSGVYNSIEKRLQHRYFPVNFANSLRTPFYRTPPGVCFWCAGQGSGNLNPKYIDSLYYQLFTGIFCNIHWSCISFGIILSESSLIFSYLKVHGTVLAWCSMLRENVRIRSHSGPYSPAFALNAEGYGVFSPNAGKYGPK